MRVYFPGGVPLEHVAQLWLLLPPHEQTNNSNRSIDRPPPSKREVRPRPEVGRMTIPTKAKVHSQPECGKALGGRAAAVAGAVVVTVAVKVEAVVGLTFTLAGTVHFAACGTPLQANVTVPLKPPPPMVSVYLAGCPAGTVADGVEAPRPRDTPVPVNATECGPWAALSATLRVALAEPMAAGVKVMVIVQLAPAAIPVPQVLVSLNSLLCGPVIVMPLILKAAELVLVNVTV